MKCRCLSHNGFLTNRGYAEVAQRGSVSLEGLALFESSCEVDSRVSVSGLRRGEAFHVFDEDLIDQQYRRHLYGS